MITKSKSKSNKNKHFLRLVVLSLLAIVLISPNLVSAATYYLDAVKGNDNNDGTLIADGGTGPWRTLARAMINYVGPHPPKVVAGDIVKINNGQYGPFVLNRFDLDPYTGDMNEPVPQETLWTTYQAADGNAEVYFAYIWVSDDFQGPYLVAHIFDGINIKDPPEAANNYTCIRIEMAVGLRFVNMDIEGPHDPSIMYNPETHKTAENVHSIGLSNDIKFQNCDISYGFKGIHTICNNLEISDCNIYNTGDDRLNISTGKNILIENNYLHLPLVKFVEAAHPDMIQIGGTTENLTFRKNRMYDHSSQGLWCSTSPRFDHKNMLWENNLIYTTGNNMWTFYNLSGAIIRNNTAVSSSRSCARFNIPIRRQGSSANTTANSNVIDVNDNSPDLSDVVVGSDIMYLKDVTGGDGNDGRGWGRFLVVGVDDINNLITVSPTPTNSQTGKSWKIAETYVGADVQVYNNLFVGPYSVEEDRIFDYHDYNIYIYQTGAAGQVTEDNSITYETLNAHLNEKIMEISAMMFNNPNANDYTLKSGCPAIDFGAPAKEAPLTDILGNPRDANPDAGCYEYESTESPAGENQKPSADAGQNQEVTDDDGNGYEQITLDGSGSTDPDGSIVSYQWSGPVDVEIPGGVNPIADFPVGEHLVRLTVTDNEGSTDFADVLITIIDQSSTPENQPPNADAGVNQQVTDDDGNVYEQVTLDGSGSTDPDGSIVSYQWSGPVVIPDGANPVANFPVGVHTVALTVTDNEGLTDSATVSITIIDQSGASEIHTIRTLAGSGGSISPSGIVQVTHGTSQTFTITPNSGYRIVDVRVNGDSQGPVASHTFNNVTSDQTIYATFALGPPDTHTVSARVLGNGGSIDPPGDVQVSHGDSLTFNIYPDTGYRIVDVMVNDVSQGPVTSYTFNNVTSNQTIYATFVAITNTYTITTNTNECGSISPSGNVQVNHGDNQEFIFMPAPGYHLSVIIVDGVTIENLANSYIFQNVTESHTITTVFAINTYLITTNAGIGGTIVPNGNIPAKHGDDLEFSIIPDQGSHISDVRVDGISVGAVSTYTFTNVTESHTIGADFEPDAVTHIISSNAGEGGDISPSGTVSVNHGNDQEFTITAQTGYVIVDVIIDGESHGDISSYTFSNITEDHTITAVFDHDTYIITTIVDGYGNIVPNGDLPVKHGDDLEFTITPEVGYEIEDVLIDGLTVGAVSTYIFNDVTEPHTITVRFVPNIFTITANAGLGGGISPSGTITANKGENFEFTITPDPGYSIANIQVDGGLVEHGEGLTTYSFDDVSENHTITVIFDINTYTIDTIVYGNGSIVPNGSVPVIHGGAMTFAITPDTGYSIDDVKVDDVSVGAVNSYTFTNVTEPHTIAAYFTSNTFTITAGAGLGGTINPSGQIELQTGQNQTFTITPNEGYQIANIKVDQQSKGAISSYTFTDITGSHTINAQFTIKTDDNTEGTKPSVINCFPAPDAIQVPVNPLIALHIVDMKTGVDPNLVEIRIDGNVIYSGNIEIYQSLWGRCKRTGTKADYIFAFQPAQLFDFDHTIDITVNAANLAGISMPEYNYSFITEMRTFGRNVQVYSDRTVTSQANPAVVRDSQGNIYTAWEAGAVGSRNIYIGKLAPGQQLFDKVSVIKKRSYDQCNPTIAVGANDKMYLAWQQNRHGNWDIHVATSIKGNKWTNGIQLTITDDNHTNPTIAVEPGLAGRIHVVWQDDRAGNSDIYHVVANNTFDTKTITAITSNTTDQTEPDITIDSEKNVHIVWTDERNGQTDIYGASSNYGPWTNTPVVSNSNNQSSPTVATESEGSILHLLWVDDTHGNKDVFYAATSGGLPSSDLIGASIIDDSVGTDQTSPSLVVVGTSGDNLKVFACWKDARNVFDGNNDFDIYFAETDTDFGTNVMVLEDRWNTEQRQAVLTLDDKNRPLIVWVDVRNGQPEIFYAGTCSISSEPLASKEIIASQDNIVGANPDNIDNVDDVSVAIPAGAFWADVNVTISRIDNSSVSDPPMAIDVIARYEFGPSSELEFFKPVTITIPYLVSEFGDKEPFWYDPQTGMLSQSGITNIEHVVISPTLHALRFKTTHFTQYVVGYENQTDPPSGGGCDMSRHGPTNSGIIEFLLPYIGLILVILAVKRRDVRKCHRKTN